MNDRYRPEAPDIALQCEAASRQIATNLSIARMFLPYCAMPGVRERYRRAIELTVRDAAVLVGVLNELAYAAGVSDIKSPKPALPPKEIAIPAKASAK